MGVYIKDVEIPMHCIDCPFMVIRDNDDCILQSAEANENFENWEQMKDGCPLIEIPEPHGRLGDLDALHNAIAANIIGSRCGEETSVEIAINEAIIDDLMIIDAQPTIIPSSEED